jgi:hypothetical protein
MRARLLSYTGFSSVMDAKLAEYPYPVGRGLSPVISRQRAAYMAIERALRLRVWAGPHTYHRVLKYLIRGRYGV